MSVLVKNNSMKNERDLSAIKLKEQLIVLTIGGSNGTVNNGQRIKFFTEYMRRALPEMRVLNLSPVSTAASLNSICATANVMLNGQRLRAFGKIHIESDTKIINAVGVEEEYQKAQLLVDAGWPVVKPLAISRKEDYPLLLYPRMDETTLFDELEKSNVSGISTLTAQQINDLSSYNQKIGQKELEELKKGTAEEAKNAPVQTLFLKRIERDGRIDQWYLDDTAFQLPGLTTPITWRELLSCTWKINGLSFDITLQNIIDEARIILAFTNEGQTFLTLTHGDDHAGNIRLTRPPVVFDPAFAGWNPATLDVKALAHTGFLPMAAMYYLPKGLTCSYQQKGNQLEVETNIVDLPMYSTHEILAKQIIDSRTLPILRKIKDLGGDMEKESQRIKSGLSACALLTVNIAKLLGQNNGMAVGLLPMAIMFSTFKGLSMLEYLDAKIKQL